MAPAALALYLLGPTLTLEVRTGDTGFRHPNTTAFTAPWWTSVPFEYALTTGLAAPVATLFTPATTTPPRTRKSLDWP